MGACCCSESKTEKDEFRTTALRSPPPEMLNIRTFKRQPTMKSKVHIEIKLSADETVGEGVKMTQAYETNL